MSSAPTWAPRLADWYRREARDLPWRRPEFAEQYGAWGTLVSEFMLQQTPVNRVIPRLETWLARWPTPAAQARATPAEVVAQWDNLGYPRRALWLRSAAVEIVERHDGIVPRDVDSLLALSGIGDYTARAVAVFSYRDRHPVVDTNIRRVIARVIDGRAQQGAPARSDLQRMTELLPTDVTDSAIFNAAMMELGAIICTARSPQCEQCPIASSCAWLAAGRPETGDERRKQARYEGSDRQARGGILRALRAASNHRLSADGVIPEWPDAVQRDRAIDSLIADGLIEARDGTLSLPHG